jgi:benzoyl-CoA reductase/2-hydroxyglutaryl-CoA dehydratase subunit BcrC/BadD/HgdB
MSKASKIHYHSPTHVDSSDYPYYMIEAFEKGYKESLCGYLRKNVTSNKGDVTCFYCKNKLR